MPKSTPSTRMRRIADLIRHELASLLKQAVGDPRLNAVALTSVDVSPDLKHAKIYFTILNPESKTKADIQEIQKAFSKASGYLRHGLAEKTVLRVVPQLRFVYDETTEYGGRLSTLIDEAVSKDEQK